VEQANQELGHRAVTGVAASAVGQVRNLIISLKLFFSSNFDILST